MSAPLAEFVRCGKDCYEVGMLDLAKDGAQRFFSHCSAETLKEVEAAIHHVEPDQAGARLFNLKGLERILGSDGAIGALAAQFRGRSVRPVRAILFDKSAGNNWALGWHQDRVIAVRARKEAPGYGPWTVKAGVHHVAPPIEVVSEMLTLRVHLDPVAQSNAPLLIARGSHALGFVPETKIRGVVEASEIVQCLADRGDIWAYCTPILHASERALVPARRRVLQLDYSPNDLPFGLEWLGV